MILETAGELAEALTCSHSQTVEEGWSEVNIHTPRAETLSGSLSGTRRLREKGLGRGTERRALSKLTSSSDSGNACLSAFKIFAGCNPSKREPN